MSISPKNPLSAANEPRSSRVRELRRVVVTGMSVGTALGFSLDEFWRRLLSGECGISRHPGVEPSSPLPVQIAGCVSDTALASALARLNLSDPDRSNQLALWAVGAALEDAGWPTDGKTPMPHDVIFGTGHGNVGFNNELIAAFLQGGYRKLRPTTVVRMMFNRPANLASIRFALTGTSFTVSCACATGAVAVGEAFQRIRFGLSECVVAACSDSGLDETTFAAWNRLGVLSKNPDPERASRPFDVARDGLVMGEGAAGLVLESLPSALNRGARIYGEIWGYGSTSDAFNLVQPDSRQQVRAMQLALEDAGVGVESIGYVNAHGTATQLADVVESASLQQVFGEHLSGLHVSNSKGQLGHLMGATVGVELVATLLALRSGQFPACKNLDEPDPRCPLPLSRGEPLQTRVRYALKNSFAFGGTNCALVLGAMD
jgi:3-oxoacyl-[acyl-carrier-protein] synthase II